VHNDSQTRKQAQRVLAWALALKLLVCGVQVTGVYYSGSLALQADSVHVAFDALGNVIGLVVIILGRQAHRRWTQEKIEAVGSGLVGILIAGAACYIIWQAVSRYGREPEILSWPLLIAAILGMTINWLNIRILGHVHLGVVHAVREHERADFLSSLAVVVGAIVLLWWPQATWLDTIISLLLGIYIFNLSVDVLLAATMRTNT